MVDCREFAKMDKLSEPAQLAVFVAIDQTTPFTAALKQSIADQLLPLLRPGTALEVYQFSAYMGGRYTQKLLQVRMNAEIEPGRRDAISKVSLDRFDKCMAFQSAEVQKLTGNALRQAFDGSSASIGKSDVAASLRDVSEQVKQAAAARKVVLIASDMLENSAVSSFYVGNAVRRIEPAVELARMESHQLIGNFGRADIYVMGAGLIAETAGKAAYRDPKTMQQLQVFWRDYFEKSAGHLVEFGAPAMLGQIR
jgi:hypothetical protein